MTTFEDGPAKGKTLMLHRSPHLLRVVRDPSGTIDALDMLEDEPGPKEELFLYRLVEQNGSCHINARDKRGRRCGGFYPVAVYALADKQPADGDLRDPARWEAFAQAEWERTGPMLRGKE